MRSSARSALTVFVLAAVVGLGFANYRLAELSPGGNDFLARWVGARAWVVSGRSPYDPEVSLEAQRLIYGRPANPAAGEDIAHFAYPLPSMIFFAPFGLMPYTLARAIWMTILQIGLGVLPLLGISIVDARWGRGMTAVLVLFSVFWYHGFRAQILGQFAVIEALLMIGALLAIRSRRDPLAGVLLALALSKPQMSFLLIPFTLLWALRARRYSVIGWALGSSALLFASSLALLPGWPLRWIWQLLDYPSYTQTGSPISVLAGASPAFAPQITTLLTTLIVLYMLWEWLQALGKPDAWFQWAAALTIVITNLVALRTATTNYVVMLPALIMGFAVLEQRWGRKARLPTLALLLVLLVGLWGLFATSLQGNREAAIMYLPVPVIALGGLWWSRWWKVRQADRPELHPHARLS